QETARSSPADTAFCVLSGTSLNTTARTSTSACAISSNAIALFLRSWTGIRCVASRTRSIRGSYVGRPPQRARARQRFAHHLEVEGVAEDVLFCEERPSLLLRLLRKRRPGCSRLGCGRRGMRHHNHSA